MLVEQHEPLLLPLLIEKKMVQRQVNLISTGDDHSPQHCYKKKKNLPVQQHEMGTAHHSTTVPQRSAPIV